MEKSYHTKMQLVSAFKEVLIKVPFRKIIVSHISDRAGMSRKSFYYHFEDKYDLVNWVFDTEFVDIMEKQKLSGWVCLERLCHYLYSNMKYYRKLLHITGQNSLSEHIEKYIRDQILIELSGDSAAEIKSVLIADSIMVMIKRWLYDMNTLSASAFVQLVYEMLIEGKRKVSSTTEIWEDVANNVCSMAG